MTFSAGVFSNSTAPSTDVRAFTADNLATQAVQALNNDGTARTMDNPSFGEDLRNYIEHDSNSIFVDCGLSMIDLRISTPMTT